MKIAFLAYSIGTKAELLINFPSDLRIKTLALNDAVAQQNVAHIELCCCRYNFYHLRSLG
jgi:hypothetical protein